MQLAIAAVGISIVVLTLIYLFRPNYRIQAISAASFFHDQPNKPGRNLRMTLSGFPLMYFAQLALLLTLLSALIWFDDVQAGNRLERIGVALFIDTSASTSTLQAGQTVMLAQQQATQDLVDHLRSLRDAGNGDLAVCLDVVAFDVSARRILRNTQPEQVMSVVNTLQHRPLATTPTLLQGAFAEALREAQAAADEQRDATQFCTPTHAVVLTDLPAPDWLTSEAEHLDLNIIWRDLSLPVPNTGVLDVNRLGSALLGWDGRLEFVFQASGAPPAPTSISITQPDGSTINLASLQWEPDESGLTQQIRLFETTMPGRYTLTLSPDGHYVYDDSLTFEVEPVEQIRVDWRLEDATWLNRLRWQQDAQTPMLRVQAYTPDAVLDPAIPLLLVGQGNYGQSAASRRLGYFAETPLLTDLNLDVAESLGIGSVPLLANSPLLPVLTYEDGTALLAQSAQPLAAYVPGLPNLPPGAEVPNSPAAHTAAFSTTAFFNAVRYLLQTRPLPPLFLRTSASQPEPDGVRNALHPAEGITAQPPYSSGAIVDIQPQQGEVAGDPTWILLLTLAAFIFAIERALSALGVSRWQ